MFDFRLLLHGGEYSFDTPAKRIFPSGLCCKPPATMPKPYTLFTKTWEERGKNGDILKYSCHATQLRRSMRRGTPFGHVDWTKATAAQLGSLTLCARPANHANRAL